MIEKNAIEAAECAACAAGVSQQYIANYDAKDSEEAAQNAEYYVNR